MLAAPFVVWLLLMSHAGAQQPAIVIQSGPSARPVNAAQVEAAQRAALEQAAEAAKRAKEKKPDEEESEDKKDEGGKKKEGEQKDGKEDDTVERPKKPPRVPDPREFDVKPDKNGKITFNFTGQSWPDVLQWLANVSSYSLDWTELPAGYLNLTTQRPYSLSEARDLINRQLHARGYTMILTGEVLSVYKIEKLDPSLVPRVEEEELYDRQPSDFVKITFSLPEGMEVATVAEDIKKVASEHAKVLPLPATRRVLMMTTVANARLVSSVLNDERLAIAGEIVPVEVVLKHRRAEKIIDILYVILGLDPAARPSQEELAIQQQKMQLLMQMQGAGKDVSKMLGKSDGPEVYLAYNSHRNSVLINAAPAEVKKIKRTIELLDVPAGTGPVNVADEGYTERTAKSYKLKTIEPTVLMQTLEEIGDLDPLTELRADNKADILFVRASAGDHEKIVKLVEELDEAGMETLVVKLRHHAADAMAGTLRAMFAPPKEDEDESRSRRFYYFGYGRGNEEEEQKPAEVRVDVDIENNRLIVRASPEQIAEIKEFLTRLGESLDGGGDDRRVRVLGQLSPEETAAMLQRIREAWPALGENDLVIEGPSDGGGSEPQDSQQEAAERDPSTSAGRAPTFRLLAERQTRKDDAGTAEAENSDKPPVRVQISPDGRLVIASEDTEALDRLERFVQATSPPQERFEVIPVIHVRAYMIYLTLTNLYEEEIKGEKEGGYFDRWNYEWVPERTKAVAPQLSKRRGLKLDWDSTSNTLLVANASPEQLREIKALVATYDVPSAGDEAKQRRTTAIKLQYSRAQVVAGALKEVYRDLLSSRDKEFETEEKKGAGTARETTTVIRYGPETGSGDDDKRKPTPVKVGFQGALSVGVDEISNTIIISVQEELFDSVLQIVRSLDEAARPQTTVAVHSVDSTMSAQALQKALSEALGTPWVGGKPDQPPRPSGENNGKGERGEGGKPGEGEAGGGEAAPAAE